MQKQKIEDLKKRLGKGNASSSNSPSTDKLRRAGLAPSEESRKSPRHSKLFPCEVLSGGSVQGAMLKDVSVSGAKVVGHGIDNFTADSARVRCALFGTRRIRVVWREVDCIGVEFVFGS